MSARTKGRHWCFTLNNYSGAELQSLSELGTASQCTYLIYGKEVGESGTPHLQGFVSFKNVETFNTVKSWVGLRCHLEKARAADLSKARDYCKKENDWTEFGIFENNQGKRTDWDKFRSFVIELGRVPSERDMYTSFPGLYARYSRHCMKAARAWLPDRQLVPEEQVPRFGWQTRVYARAVNPPIDRKITFVVDPSGNSGKTWLCLKLMSLFPDRVQILGIGKRDDLAYMLDESKNIFLVDIPRSQMIFLQYSVLEMIKNGLVISPKYESGVKVLHSSASVIVFSNEPPDMTALTSDRYEIINI